MMVNLAKSCHLKAVADLTWNFSIHNDGQEENSFQLQEIQKLGKYFTREGK
jgi:hypothetical protein